MNISAVFRIGGGKMTADVVKVNSKTVLVRIKSKEKEEAKDLIVPKFKVIKRHKIKHNVELEGE
jgi:hypothetical protein